MSVTSNTETTSTAADTPPSTAINSEIPAIQLQESRDTSGDAEKARSEFTRARAENRRADLATKEALKAEILSKNLKNRETEIAEAEAKYEAGKTKPAGAKADEPKGDSGAKTEAKSDDTKTDGAKREQKADEPKTDEPKQPSRHVQTIARQNQEIRDLKAKLATYEGKPAVETKADFIAKAKADPSILFQEVDPELLTKLAEVRYRDLTPEEKLRAEFDAKLAERDKKAAEAEAAAKEAQAKVVDQQVYGSIAQILNNGLKGEDGKTLIDNSRWTLCQKVTSAGEADAPRMAMNIAVALQKDLGRKPSDAETQQILEIAFDQLEGAFRKKADVYRLDTPKDESPKTDTVQGAKDQRPKTLNNRMASGGRVPTNIKPKLTTKAEREAYKDRLLQEHIRRSRAAASV